MYYIPEELLDEIENLKREWKFDEALKKVNKILVKDPTNEEALLQVADIEYRRWELDKATKAIDFFNDRNQKQDVMWLYVKWVLEMDKNKRYTAKQYFKQALKLSKLENPEIIRCYWLCEYWYWNREKWLDFLEQAFEQNKLDAEIIYNMIELYLLEYRYQKAKRMINYYYANKEKIEFIDKDPEFYDEKIWLFKNFIKNYVSNSQENRNQEINQLI